MNKQQGAILFTSLMITTIMTLLVLASFDTALLETRISGNMAASARAFANAENLLTVAEQSIGKSVPADKRYSVKHLGCFSLPGNPANSCSSSGSFGSFIHVYEVTVAITDSSGGVSTLKSYYNTTNPPNPVAPTTPHGLNLPLGRRAWIDF